MIKAFLQYETSGMQLFLQGHCSCWFQIVWRTSTSDICICLKMLGFGSGSIIFKIIPMIQLRMILRKTLDPMWDPPYHNLMKNCLYQHHPFNMMATLQLTSEQDISVASWCLKHCSQNGNLLQIESESHNVFSLSAGSWQRSYLNPLGNDASCWRKSQPKPSRLPLESVGGAPKKFEFHLNHVLSSIHCFSLPFGRKNLTNPAPQILQLSGSLVNRKWERWFVCICTSYPSLVAWQFETRDGNKKIDGKENAKFRSAIPWM